MAHVAPHAQFWVAGCCRRCPSRPSLCRPVEENYSAHEEIQFDTPELDVLPSATLPLCDSVNPDKQKLPFTTTINGVHGYIYIIPGTEFSFNYPIIRHRTIGSPQRLIAALVDYILYVCVCMCVDMCTHTYIHMTVYTYIHIWQ